MVLQSVTDNCVTRIAGFLDSSTLRQTDVLRLFCFPYAGGSASIYKTWGNLLAGVAEVYPIHLPGRGKRIGEPPYYSVSALIEDLLPSMLTFLDRPFCFFGHSMGAAIAFDLARVLEQNHGLNAAHLFVSAKCPPHLSRTEPFTYDQPDDEFLANLKSLNGTPTELLDDQEVMRMLLPLLRADFQLVQSYQYCGDAPLSCPITVFGGLRDGKVPVDDLKRWRELTQGSCHISMLAGDHFFIDQCRNELISSLARILYPLRLRKSS
jgi:medium-chain acyl-[acyl-carrier-protein] hydrolase